MDFLCDRLSIKKTSNGAYICALAPVPGSSDVDFGFELEFLPRKEPIRNGLDGDAPGKTKNDTMFYYSITRMDVSESILEVPAKQDKKP